MDSRSLCLLYLMSEASPEEVAALAEWISESPEHAQAFALLAAQDAHLSTAVGKRCKPAHEPAGVLQEIADLEQAGHDEPAPPPIHLDASTLTRQKYVSALSYIARHTFTPKRVVVVATAAALLLGVVLAIVFLGGNDGAPNIAEVPEYTPVTPTPNPNVVVATVTDQAHAVWVSANGEGALPDRTLLGPTQRLTLRRGFAEITTNRGAKVLVQAPATIETTDSDNAIRLHRGRLVGRCLTPASKGFVVLTPNARIVDVGTEFGVELARDGTLQAHVLDGEITLTPVTEGGEGLPVSLREGEARRVSADASLVQAIEADPYRFVRGMDEQDRDPMRGYVAEVKAMQPLIYYRFESIGLDGKIINEMGDRYHGRVVDRVTLEQTGAGMAGRFAGGHVEIDEAVREMDGLESYTLSCWVKPDRHHGAGILSFTVNDEQFDLDTSTSTGLLLNDNRPGFEQDEHNRVRFIHRNPPGGHGGTEAVMKDPYAVGQWMHLVAVKQRGTMRLYVNGELTIEVEETTSHADVQPSLLIGTSLPKESNIDPRLFEGLIDEVAVYDKALSTDVIRRHFARMNPLINPDQEEGP